MLSLFFATAHCPCLTHWSTLNPLAIRCHTSLLVIDVALSQFSFLFFHCVNVAIGQQQHIFNLLFFLSFSLSPSLTVHLSPHHTHSLP